MPKERRAITPWAHLSIAFDLCDRCPLPLSILGDSCGRIARVWRFERLCRRARMSILMILLISCAVVFAVAMLAIASRSISGLLEEMGDFILIVLQIWFVGWIAAAILTFVAGLLAAPWRLRARPYLLLHAERLRRHNLNPIPASLLSKHSIKNRLVSASLVEELLSPLMLVAIVVVIAISSVIRPVFGLYGAGLFLILTIPIAGILRRRASRRSGSGLAYGLSHALTSSSCPACQYSLVGTGPSECIRRCPECGMRFPCRLPVNFPPTNQSLMEKLGAAIRRRFG